MQISKERAVLPGRLCLGWPMWLEGWSGTSARGELQGQRGGSEGPDHTGERLASFFFKGPDNKYFRLWSYKVSTIQMPL